MINNLRKKLKWLLFLLPMIVFTGAFILMMGNTVTNVRESEMRLAENMAEEIMEQIDNGTSMDELNLSIYSSYANAWIRLIVGDETYTTTESAFSPSEKLLQELTGNHYSLEVSALGENRAETSSTIYPTGHHIGVVTSVFEDGSLVYELTLITPQTSAWDVVKNNATKYLMLWSITTVLMYLLSYTLSKKAVQPVSEAMKSQKEFIAAASHELKTPLAVIQANAETMEPGKKQDIILDECSRMGSLIGSLLALASCDAGSWQMNIQPTDLDSLLIETWEHFTEYARKKQIHLQLDLAESFLDLQCDKDRISQALGILLDNAITYSEPGQSIEITAKQQGKNIVLSVIDHGPGIPDDEKKRVFERFYTCDQSRTKKGHYGLGLSIASEIIRLHNGDMILRDTQGGGATFEIWLHCKA